MACIVGSKACSCSWVQASIGRRSAANSYAACVVESRLQVLIGRELVEVSRCCPMLLQPSLVLDMRGGEKIV
jgi:hypothetical protein